MKVVTIVGTRPELIKLSAVISRLDKSCNHILVHTGQNFDYELNEIFFEDLSIRKPDYFLDSADENFAYTIAKVISNSYDVLVKEQPEALLVYGDTNSCLSVIVAKRLQIPVFHMEAGNRCFDERVPEELNRRIVDHSSDINLPISDHARNYLEREGIAPNTIIKVGSSMNEVLNNQKDKINSSTILSKLNVNERDYIVVSLHREENVDNITTLTNIIETINHLSTKFKKTIIFSIHPRTKNKLENFDLLARLSPNVIQLRPLGFSDYVKLQKMSFCVISDSGTISEESSILKFPAITIRQTHERPEAMDEGTVIMTGFSRENITKSINIVTTSNPSRLNTVEDYRPSDVSEKVVRIIYSYVDFINKNVWKK